MALCSKRYRFDIAIAKLQTVACQGAQAPFQSGVANFARPESDQATAG
jgi:hypothetical protein